MEEESAAPPKKRRPAGVWLAVVAGEHSTAQYVVGRSSEECCGWRISCCLVDCWLCCCLAAGRGWMHGGPCLYEPTPAMSGR